MIFILICAIFTIQLIQPVKAESKVCCEKTKEDSAYGGIYCQYTVPDNCDSGYRSTGVACEQTDYCGTGCCIVDGGCNRNTPKSTCLDEDGAWYPGIECDIPRCQIGCCALPGGCSVVEEAVCAESIEGYESLRLADVFNPSITSELACQQTCLSEEEGCCVSVDTCKFTSRKDCNQNLLGSQFFKETICSSLPSCRVTGQHHTGCLPDRDEVYWFDSAGNRENIYGTDYRTDGLVVPKEDSCDPPTDADNNARDPNCGNCDYSKGSICSEAEANFLGQVPDKVSHMCISLDCTSTIKNDKNSWMKGQPRVNMESWCEYEGAVGGGKDLVGSRHYRHLCVDGREIIEPCEERREGEYGVCVQQDVPESLAGVKRTAAICRPNPYLSCMACNNEEVFSTYDLSDDEEDKIDCGGECNLYCKEESDKGTGGEGRKKCEDDTGSVIPEAETEIYEDEDGKSLRPALKECCNNQAKRQKCCESNKAGCYWNEDIRMCAPEIPPGTSDNCFGEITCTEIWERHGILDVGWYCVENCDQESDERIDGYSKGYCHKSEYTSALNSFCRSLGDCGVHVNVLGKATGSGFSSEGPSPVDELGGGEIDLEYPEDPEIEGWSLLNKQNTPLGSDDDLFLMSYIGDLIFSIEMPLDAREFYTGFGDWAFVTLSATAFLVFAGIISAVSVAAVGVTAGLSFGSAMVEIASFTLLGPAAGVAGTGIIAAVPIVGWAIFILLVGLGFLFLFGTTTEQITYTYTCGPWQPPRSGQDCEECMEFSECDEYKCESLGSLCEFINQEGEGICIVSEDANDATAPIIKPLPILPRTMSDFKLTPQSSGGGGYEFKDIIPVYTPLEIGIKTLDTGGNNKEYAQCKISRFHKDYEEMTVWFGDNYWKYEHKMEIPVIGEGGTIPADQDVIKIMPGQLNTFYVRCENRNGVHNENDYFIKFTVEDNPDMISPMLEEPKFSILNNAYIPYGTSEIDLIIFLNEPVDPVIGGCKYSTTPNQKYEDMPHNFACSSTTTYQNLYTCTTTLTGLQNNKDNVFYFKCRDRSENNNVNKDDIPIEGYHLRGSIPLEITDSGPSGTVFSNIGEVELTVKTKDGAEKDGSSTCYYSLGGFDTLPLVFSNTGSSSIHSTIAYLEEGSQKIYTWCRDIAGNEDTVEIEFVLEADNEGPEIIKLYEDISTTPSMLHVSTDELAICQYSTEGRFTFGTGTDMSVSETTEHKAEWGSTVYYVLCEDRFNNPSPLTIIYP